MAGSEKDRRQFPGEHCADASNLHDVLRSQLKEYNYVLEITPDDFAILEKYREQVAAGTAGFAEIYHDYLYSNPDITDMLYARERQGVDISKLVRYELKCLTDGIFSQTELTREAELLACGRFHQENDYRPAWVIGAYRLIIDHLREQLNGLAIPLPDKHKLKTCLTKVLLRDLGIVLEGYWQTSYHLLGNEQGNLYEQLRQAEDLLAGFPYLIWSVDVKTSKLICQNKAMQALYPQGPEAPIPFLSDTEEADQQLLLSAWQDAVNGTNAHIEVQVSLAGGDRHWYRLSLYPATTGRGRPDRINCFVEDIDRLISERKQLEQLATTDSLTGVPNRALLVDHIVKALAASRRVPGSQVVVISVDINHFKMYNDTLGRDVGDILLRDVAIRLNSIVRESDSLARLGGDQFGILLQPVSDFRTATDRVITQILDSFDIPFSCQDKQLCVSLTLGIACFPDDGANEATLLANAESAMHRAKRNSLPYQYFDPTNDVSPAEQLRYSGQIGSALHNNEFELHYQPQVDIETSTLVGAEALLRWEHPKDGIIMPQRIIPVAEQLGMISPITNWVLVTALQQCKQWSYDGVHIPVSVNVSARSFQNPRLLEKIHWALHEADIDGDYLEIEITEATLMQDLERAASVLNELSNSGVTIAIDDFGTGYSSLSYLKRLPIHTLKIDQSFIADIAFDKQDVAIVRSIIDLGHNLGCKVIAEGVENISSWKMLSSLGCDMAQGFHISKPLTDAGFVNWASTAARQA